MPKRSICTSQSFLYRNGNEIRMSSAVLYLDGEYLRYRVTFDNDLLVTITPSAFPGSAGSIVWTQSIRPDEIAQPRDLIQSLGEGIESLR